MNLNWSNRVIKYILFVFNLLLVISGIIMIAVGVSVKAYYTDYDIFLSNDYFSLPNLLIAIGSLIFFISFFGCCGAIRESWFMVFMFSILLSIIFIMEFSAGIAGYVLRDNTVSYLETRLSESMDKYTVNGDKPNGETKMWDLIQEEFECCGTKGPADWPPHYHLPTVTTVSSTISSSVESSSASTASSTDSTTVMSSTNASTETTSNQPGARRKRDAEVVTHPFITLQRSITKDDLPWSCCKSNPGATGTVTCSLTDNSTATYYPKGCIDKFGDYLKEHAVTIGGVGIAIALIQLFGVIFACHLTRQLKNGFYST